MFIELIVMMARYKSTYVHSSRIAGVASTHTVDSVSASLSSARYDLGNALTSFIKGYIHRFVDSDAVQW